MRNAKTHRPCGLMDKAFNECEAGVWWGASRTGNSRSLVSTNVVSALVFHPKLFFQLLICQRRNHATCSQLWYWMSHGQIWNGLGTTRAHVAGFCQPHFVFVLVLYCVVLFFFVLFSQLPPQTHSLTHTDAHNSAHTHVHTRAHAHRVFELIYWMNWEILLGKCASAGNRTRVTSMAMMYSTTRPLMLLVINLTGGFPLICWVQRAWE